MKKIRILIADDHALLREGVRAILEPHDDFTVVGEASDGEEAVDLATKLHPDVVLMDIAMPGLGGLEATLEIRRRCATSKILVLTQYQEREYIFRFLEAGASGFILKTAAGTELIHAIRSVFRGERYLAAGVAGEVIDEFLANREDAGEKDPYKSLTVREKQVLKLVAEGMSNKNIASVLGISPKTAMTHRSNILQKLHLENRTDLIKFAIARGVIKVAP